VLVKALEKLYGVSLPFPTFPGSPDDRLSRFRSFCSDPMERNKHLWDSSLRLAKVGKSSRFSIWMSIFLFRKTIPARRPSIEGFLDAVSEPAPEVDPAFMEFVSNEVPKMFKLGWDSKFEKRVETNTLSVSACVESKRSRGGNRMFWLERCKDDARKEFSQYLRGEEFITPPSELKEIETGGKVRLITVPPFDYSCLLPLHHAMYDHLSRFSWLLRGDAKPGRFCDFLKKEGEVFVSGDYESATDSLNSSIQKEILRLILQQCQSVPNGLRRLAMSSLSHLLTYSGDGARHRTVMQKNGQMMGYPLSFPLLCIVNYLSFKYATMDRNIPVKINGDDIVFRASPRIAKRWMEQVGKAGLKLSIGKTLMDSSIFTLNSTLFKASCSKVRLVPFIRAKALFGKEDSFCSLPGRYRSAFPGFRASSRLYLRSVFIRQNIGWWIRSGRSFNRGLGMSVSESVLRLARVWTRECSLLSLPVEKLPPCERSVFEQRPLGYELRLSDKKRDDDPGAADAIVEAAWRLDKDRRDYEEYYKGGSSVPVMKWKKFFGLTRAEFRKIIEQRNKDIFDAHLKTKKKVFRYWAAKQSPLRCGEVVDHDHNQSDSADDELEEFNEKPVPNLVLKGTAWDCRSKSDMKLLGWGAGAKVRIFRNGVGIGPPTSF
jgi:hypothetical protein